MNAAKRSENKEKSSWLGKRSQEKEEKKVF